MKIYTLQATQILPIAIEEAWSYFSNPVNLQEITPKHLNFRITSELPEKMYQGMIVTYKVHPFMNIPITWVTEITTVEYLKFFVDEQRFGPYKFWHHQHIFTPKNEGTEMKDIVHYALPFSFLGNIANSLIVKKELDAIFAYRYEFLKNIFQH